MADNNHPANAQEDNSNNLLKPPQKKQIINTAGKIGKSHHEYLKVMDGEKGVTQFRKITREELSKHKTKDSAWLSLGGIVYDVTVYLSYHPGGTIMLEGCGIECSDLFNQYHPWVNAKYLLEKYKIGFLAN